ncbi:MAG: MATE family efflux transporter [Acutalibacteraceae bacterium]
MNRRGILDMTTGPYFKKIIFFSFPLILTGVLQLIYNAADIMVIGRFAGSVSLAAVGSTSSLVNLILNLFIGLSTGSGVVCARLIGANDDKGVRKCVHTAMAMSIVSGVFVGILGFLISGPILKLMDTPTDILHLASLYLKIYFLGAPGSLVFNFGASIIRSTGDTKRPLFILAFSGIVNVLLNLVLVTVFHLNVAGVAIATITAQYISAVAVVLRLLHLENSCRLHISKIKLHKDELKEIIKIGLPAGFQSSLFSLSNVLIQSTINTFGSVAVAGNTAAQNADAFVYTSTNAIAQTAMTFTSQNMGAKKYQNIRKVYFICLTFAFGVSAVLGGLSLAFPGEIIGIFTTDPAVIEMGKHRIYIMMSTYFLCSIMDVAGCQIRGMGKSLEPMIITLLGACGIRVLWLYTGFPLKKELWNLYLSYPISWFVTFVALFICFFVFEKRIKKSEKPTPCK